MKPFNREKFLLLMLAAIFVWQAALFTFGTISCFRAGGIEACPNLGDRYENTVGIMIATTLALLGAGAVASAASKKEEEPKKEPNQSRMGSESRKKEEEEY